MSEIHPLYTFSFLLTRRYTYSSGAGKVVPIRCPYQKPWINPPLRRKPKKIKWLKAYQTERLMKDYIHDRFEMPCLAWRTVNHMDRSKPYFRWIKSYE